MSFEILEAEIIDLEIDLSAGSTVSAPADVRSCELFAAVGEVVRSIQMITSPECVTNSPVCSHAVRGAPIIVVQ